MASSSEVLRAIDPRGYFGKFFERGIFPTDARPLLAAHKLVFKQGECGGVGSSIVTLGNVTVSCAIEASISLTSDAPLIRVEIAETQQLDEKIAQEYCSVLLTMFEQEFFVRRDAMRCRNSRGEKLPLDWVFTIVVKVLSVDGDLMDTVVCAIGAALKNVKLPTIVLNHAVEDESVIEKTQIMVDKTTYPLEIDEILMSCTFGVFSKDDEQKNSEILLVSPNDEISKLCKSTVTLIIGNEKRIVRCRQRGACSDFQLLKKMTEITAERRVLFVEALEKS